MQRDMDLVRQILLKIEESPDAELRKPPTIMGWSEKQVVYHLDLLSEAGLIATKTQEFVGEGRVWRSIALKWAGHEFLDAARDESRWQMAKKKLGGALNTVSLAVLQDLLTTLARSAAGLP